jgi:pimeloyl-ACP methyl ester carboxylesterase
MSPTALEHHTIRLTDVALHYVTCGQGDAIVLLHGWPQTWYEWRKIIPALAQRYTVIAPDMRGLGDSSRPATGYDKRTIAADIYQLVRQLGHERIFLAGHDWGGPVAYAYACAHPGDVRKLVVLDVPIPGPGFEHTLTFRPRGVWHVQFHNVRDLPEALVSGRERTYLTWFYRSAYDPTAISEQDIDEYVRCYSAPGGLRAGFEYYRAIFIDVEHNRENAKTRLKMPVLALGGERGFGELTIKSMQQLAENVQGEVIERCGHWIPEERHDYLADRLLKFFAEE